MRVIHIGEGERQADWLRWVDRHPVAQSAGIVAAGSSRLPTYRSLEEAIDAIDDALVIAVGQDAALFALQALERKRPVIVDGSKALDAETFHRLIDAARRHNCALRWLHHNPYARRERLLRRLMRASGAIGHVSCMDRTLEPSGLGQLARAGCAHFDGLRRLLDARPLTVMARLAEPHAPGTTTELFLELERDLHVHYTSIIGDGGAQHELWIEGERGSLKTDGRRVWWRRRGWPRFAPLALGFTRADDGRAASRRLLDEVLGRREVLPLDEENVLPAALATCAVESHRQGAPVTVAELLH